METLEDLFVTNDTRALVLFDNFCVGLEDLNKEGHKLKVFRGGNEEQITTIETIAHFANFKNANFSN